MAVYNGKKLAHEKLLEIATYCVHACYKAPQITGRVEIECEIVTGKDLEPIMDAEMILGRTAALYMGSALSWQKAYYGGEAPVLLLIGGKGLRRSELVWNCGACGFRTCKEFNKYARSIEPSLTVMAKGPMCMWKTIDYGAVCTWACAQAWMHNITNRAEIASGRAAQVIGYLEDCDAVLGLPLGPMRDLYWYSRDVVADFLNYDLWKEMTMLNYPVHWGGFPGDGRPTVKVGQEWWKTSKDRALVDTDIQAIEVAKKGIAEDIKTLKERVQVSKIQRENE